MKKIGVIGAGAMGSGIAQVAAMSGCEVYVFDQHSPSVTKARDAIQQSLNKFAEKGKLQDAEAKAIFGRIFFIENLESFADTELVIEAIVEDEGAKKQLFSALEKIVSSETILASNTSSLSITSLAGALQHPQRFVGIHFFNPPVLMRLVEIIPALQTKAEIVDICKTLITSWGKTAVIAKDTPGFIVNRIARPYYSEALRIHEEQIASTEVIDAAMRARGFKMGPFELMDFIGNDINLAVTKSVWTATYFEARYKPSYIQENLVRAGWLGRKTGKGYYEYNTERNPIEISPEQLHLSDRIIAMLINEAAEAHYMGIASKEDIELAMVQGVNYPKGLLAWADEDIDYWIVQMDNLYDHYREERYRCSAGLRKMAGLQQKYFA